jgi:aryl-alcohol dehydrogenase-like predicted oxidoreductase
LDYVDLYQIHRWDSRTPIEETMEALHEVVRSGKVRYLGASSAGPRVLAGNRTRSGERKTTRSSTDTFADTLYEQPTDFDVVEAAQQVAEARNMPTARVALAWLLAKPGVTAPIVGSTKLSHLEGALAAEDLDLTTEEMGILEKPYVPHPVLGHS